MSNLSSPSPATLSRPSTRLPQPCLSPLAEYLRASLPSQALDWPCGLPTCTGQCVLCRISLPRGPLPIPPSRDKRLLAGGYIRPDGYACLKVSGMGDLVHRLVYELAYDRPIPCGFSVHHRDGNKLNNCPPNLALVSCAAHSLMHAQRLPALSYCPFCSLPFIPWTASTARARQRFCSHSCHARYRHGYPHIFPENPTGFTPYDPRTI